MPEAVIVDDGKSAQFWTGVDSDFAVWGGQAVEFGVSAVVEAMLEGSEWLGRAARGVRRRGRAVSGSKTDWQQ
jgi:hypothetical protein